MSYDTDISYNINDSLAESQTAIRVQISGAGINGNLRNYSDDYGREISKDIGIPTTDNEFEFSLLLHYEQRRKMAWTNSVDKFINRKI